VRPSPHDREIARLAVPALGALAAEPLYLLADTAIVGHLGTVQLAALALAATYLGGVVAVFNFLTYGTTSQVARLHGAGAEERAGTMAAQALWVALGLGAILLLVTELVAGPAIRLLGGDGHVADLAARYLRIGALGLPCALVALAGQGYLRGVSDLRTPLAIVAAGNAANVVLELVLVYGAGWGLDGSALGTVIAQAGMGAAFVAVLLAAPAVTRRPQWPLMRPILHIGGAIALRTGALLGAFTLASAVLARVGPAALGAHQIAYQLFLFLALALDAIAIAGQVIVGRSLGAGDAELAEAAAKRMIGWSLAVGLVLAVVLLAGIDLIPRAFTDDADVLHQAHRLWPLFALTLPTGSVVFALDGILLGAGDVRYLAATMAMSALVFVPIALASSSVVGIWVGLNVLMAARLATTYARFLSRRWAVTGAAAPGAP
jgi:putative MATE family efflux protein